MLAEEVCWYTCDNCLGGRLNANDLNLLTNLDNALLNTTSYNSSSPLNAENIFYREGEGAVQGPGGVWNVVINSLHQLQNGFPVEQMSMFRSNAPVQLMQIMNDTP